MQSTQFTAMPLDFVLSNYAVCSLGSELGEGQQPRTSGTNTMLHLSPGFHTSSPILCQCCQRWAPVLTLYQPMTHICVMSSHKPIRMYMGGLILGVNTLYRLFCFFKLFPMVGKGLRYHCQPKPKLGAIATKLQTFTALLSHDSVHRKSRSYTCTANNRLIHQEYTVQRVFFAGLKFRRGRFGCITVIIILRVEFSRSGSSAKN